MRININGQRLMDADEAAEAGTVKIGLGMSFLLAIAGIMIMCVALAVLFVNGAMMQTYAAQRIHVLMAVPAKAQSRQHELRNQKRREQLYP